MNTHENDNRNYAIIRVKKLSDFKKIDELIKHNSRQIKVANADQQRNASNIDFRDFDEIKTQKLSENVREYIASFNIKPRRNAIVAFEVIMTFSHEMSAHINVNDWAIASMKWAEETWNSRNIIYAILHYDEKTPHIHLVVVPIVPYTGPRKFKNRMRLDYKTLLGGRSISESKKKLSTLQDSYAEAMRPFGLRRGVKGSKLKNMTMKQIYKQTAVLKGQAEAEIAEFFTELAALQTKISSQKREKLSADERARTVAEILAQLDILKSKAKASFDKLIERASSAWRADGLEQERQIFEKKLRDAKKDYEGRLESARQNIAALKESVAKQGEIINTLQSQARAIPVEHVIEKLTGIAPRETENDDQKRFVFAHGLRLVTTADGRFKNETPDIPGGGTGGDKRGGKGAIDAVLFLKGWSPIEAIEWLVASFSLHEIGPTIAEMEATQNQAVNRKNVKREVDALTKNAIEAWPLLKKQLVDQGLDESTIDNLHKHKWLGATASGHVRVTRANRRANPAPGSPDYEIAGILLQDAQPPTPDLGFRLETGDGGYVPVRTSRKSDRIILTDDILEALAITTRESTFPPERRSNIITIGRKKSQKNRDLLRALAENFQTIIVAVSSTPAAKAFAAWVASIVENVHLWLPPKGLERHLESLSFPIDSSQKEPGGKAEPDPGDF